MTGTTGNAYISPIEEHEFGTTLIVYASANDTLAWVVGGDNTLSLYGGETSGGFQLIG
jgi:GTP cyclohydrolase III